MKMCPMQNKIKLYPIVLGPTMHRGPLSFLTYNRIMILQSLTQDSGRTNMHAVWRMLSLHPRESAAKQSLSEQVIAFSFPCTKVKDCPGCSTTSVPLFLSHRFLDGTSPTPPFLPLGPFPCSSSSLSSPECSSLLYFHL